MRTDAGSGRVAGRWLGRCLLLGGLALAPVGHAALGESRASVQADREALNGSSTIVTTTATYEVHETRTADGTRLREFVNPGGRVFAVTWSGRFQPDLEKLLASHYPEYLAAAGHRRGGHHVVSVSTPELVLSIVQLPRGFSGSAHVPSLVPPGVKPEELR